MMVSFLAILAYAAVVAAQVLDAVTTHAVLRDGGREQNPVARFLAARIGLAPYLVLKAAMFAVAGAALLIAAAAAWALAVFAAVAAWYGWWMARRNLPAYRRVLR